MSERERLVISPYIEDRTALACSMTHCEWLQVSTVYSWLKSFGFIEIDMHGNRNMGTGFALPWEAVAEWSARGRGYPDDPGASSTR